MSQSLEECKARLANIQSYRRQFVMVTKAAQVSNGATEFSFRGPLGFDGHTVLRPVETGSPAEVAFESAGGNVDVMGLVQFTEIRPDCTEVNIAVHYEIRDKIYAWFDSVFGFVNRFMDSELRSIRAHFEGVAAPAREPRSIYATLEPVSA